MFTRHLTDVASCTLKTAFFSLPNLICTHLSCCRYAKALVDPSLHGLGDDLLRRFDDTEKALLTVSMVLNQPTTCTIDMYSRVPGAGWPVDCWLHLAANLRSSFCQHIFAT